MLPGCPLRLPWISTCILTWYRASYDKILVAQDRDTARWFKHIDNLISTAIEHRMQFVSSFLALMMGIFLFFRFLVAFFFLPVLFLFFLFGMGSYFVWRAGLQQFVFPFTLDHSPPWRRWHYKNGGIRTTFIKKFNRFLRIKQFESWSILCMWRKSRLQ